jgi:hypothetical protein
LAIYHCSIKIITRGKGKTAVAAAAYRAAARIVSEYEGRVNDYTRKDGVVHTEILLPGHAPREYSDRAVLWNAVEKAEVAKNAQLAREIEIALPVELTLEQNISLARRYVQETFVFAGMCADICIHDPDREQPNPHAHILLTMRPLDGRGEWAAKSRKKYILTERGEKIVLPSGEYKTRKINAVDWNDRTKAEDWRQAWAAYANNALRMAGKLTEDNVLDHRSYERQGKEQIPTVHLGVAATQMERKGIRTERGDINREIEISNKKLLQLRARINKLNDWLDNAEVDTNPTLYDIISAMTSGNPDRSQWAKIRDTQMAAKALIFFEQNNIKTIVDLRGKVADFYAERQTMSDKLKPFERRIKTLDLHLLHSERFTKNRKIAVKRDALFAEAHKLDTQSLIFKGKANDARKKAEDYDWKNLNALQAYDEAEKYLRGVLQKRFDPKNIPIAKWRQERETLAREMGGLNTEYAILKERIAEVERIRKYAEEVQRAINPPQQKMQNRDVSL